MESNISRFNNIGKLIDKLDMQSINKELDIKDIDVNLIKNIENQFAQLNIDLMSGDEKITLYYTHANYQAIIKNLSLRDFKYIKIHSEHVKSYSDLEEFIFNNYSDRIDVYRKAIKLIENGTMLSKLYTSQVYVNLSNLYMEMGRVVESIQTLMNANNIVKGFQMASGNLAIKHYSLATRTTDESVMRFLMDKGLSDIKDTIDNATEGIVPLDILNMFCEWELFIEKSIDTNLSQVEPWDKSEDVDDNYKNWCSKKQLSLNYINVIYKMGNVDNIHMPNMGVGYFGQENNMEYYAWFNTIKQEYNMARYFMYQIEALENFSNGHESQKHNFIVNTLDYPVIGYKTEMLKNSLKVAFSVLDKIGMFCCHFHNQQMPIHKISFHKWYKQIKREIATRSSFNALYWLSQDLDTNKGVMKDIRLLRNCLEHRYVRILECCTKPLSEELSDDKKYEYIIGYNELERKAFETLMIVRNAIIYMASGFNIEFNRFYYDSKRDHPFIPLMVDEYDDDWKN